MYEYFFYGFFGEEGKEAAFFGGGGVGDYSNGLDGKGWTFW